MKIVIEEKKYELKSKQQVCFMMKDLLYGILLILAIGILNYLFLFILMLFI